MWHTFQTVDPESIFCNLVFLQCYSCQQHVDTHKILHSPLENGINHNRMRTNHPNNTGKVPRGREVDFVKPRESFRKWVDLLQCINTPTNRHMIAYNS
jgi:hypothetical protein